MVADDFASTGDTSPPTDIAANEEIDAIKHGGALPQVRVPEFATTRHSESLITGLASDINLKRFFDPDWYQRIHKLPAGTDALRHQLENNWMPAPFFCEKSYLRENPDAAEAGNAFLHFVTRGAHERRSLGLDAELVATMRRLNRDFDWSGIDETGLLPSFDPGAAAPVIQPTGVMPEPSVSVDALQMASYLHRSASVDLISFDVWDTLLRRCCHPDEVKLHAADILQRELRCNGRASDVTASGLFRLRQLAEWRVADNHYEYRYAEVLTEWLILAGVVKDDERQRLASLLLEAELSFEMRVTRVDPTGYAMLVSHPDVPKIAISDFYMSGREMQRLLAHHGLASHFRAIYVSSDYKQTKREGSLFRHVLSSEGIAADRMLHIGDNAHADCAIPAAMNIDALHYVDYTELRRRAFFDARFDAQLKGDGKFMLAGLAGPTVHGDEAAGRQVARCKVASAAADTVCAERPSPAEMSSIDMLAMGFLGFGLFTLDRAKASGAESVYFATREGIFFRRVCDLLIRSDVSAATRYPATELISVSRRSTFAPSLRNLSIEEMMRIWAQYSTQSMAAMARSLNFDLDMMAGFCSRFDIELDEEIQYPWQDARVQALFDDAEFCAWGGNALLSQRREILAYLERIGFEPSCNRDRFFVDIGWRGTIQDNLARLVRGRIEGVYLALYPYLTEQPFNSVKHGFLANHNGEGDRYDVRSWAALEFITNGRGGSVVDFVDGRPRTEIFEQEEAFLATCIQPLQEQILVAIEKLLTDDRFVAFTHDSLRMIAREAFRAFVDRPAPGIAAMFQKLNHNETFGTGKVQSMSYDLAKLDAEQPADLHAGVRKILAMTPWPEAWTRADSTRKAIADLPLDFRLALPRHSGLVRAPAVVRSLGESIAIYAPPPIAGSGGHRTIYMLARALDAAGYRVDLFSEARGNFEYKEQELFGSDIRLHDSWQAGVTPSAAFATIWNSAGYLVEFLPKDVPKFYFIQDLEAVFNPLSDGYLRAENSYTLGLNAICVGRWLPHVLRSQYGIGAATGGLGVDTGIYHPISNPQLIRQFPRRNEIAVLYQPEKWRRAPELCLAALDLVKRQRPDVVISFYGSTEGPVTSWSYRHLGLVKDLNELNVLYNTAKIGLCLSLSNPSRIPFEMMAAGCVPVDVYRYNNLFDYADGTALLAFQTAESLAAAMLNLLGDEQNWQERSKRSITVAANRTMAWEMDTAVNAVDFCLSGGSLNDLPPTLPSYTQSPFLAASDSNESVMAWCRNQQAQAGLVGGTGC